MTAKDPNPNMQDAAPTTTSPPDILLLLRVHGEQRWLCSKVVPLLRALEQDDSIPLEDLGAAISYLEVMWLEAGLRAATTDAAASALEQSSEGCSVVLSAKARRYHAAVCRLRQAVDGRVRAQTRPDAPARAEESTI
jgi:hypothetical protein